MKKFFLLLFFLFGANAFSGIITSSDYGSSVPASTPFFGWKTIPSPSNNFKLVCTATVTASDLHIALKYGTTGSYLELAIGGWANTKSVLRDFASGASGGDVEMRAAAAGQTVLPGLKESVLYTIIISDSKVTITGQTSSGVIFNVQPPFSSTKFASNFTGYSFKTYNSSPITIENDVIVPLAPPSTPYTAGAVPLGTADYWVKNNGIFKNENLVDVAAQQVAPPLTITKDAAQITIKNKSTGVTALIIPASAWPTYSSVYNFLLPLGAVPISLTAAQIAAANVVLLNAANTSSTAGTYEGASGGFGWKQIVSSGNNFKLSFSAIAASDLCISFKGSARSVEVVLGIAGNLGSAVRTVNTSSLAVTSQLLIPPDSVNSAIIPDVTNLVNYVVSIVPESGTGKGILTINGITNAGASIQIMSMKDVTFSDVFSAYSFKMLTGTLRMSADTITLLSLPAGASTIGGVAVGKYWMQKAGVQPYSYLTDVATFSSSKPSSANISVTNVTPTSISYTINDVAYAGLMASDLNYWFLPGPADVAPAPTPVPVVQVYNPIAAGTFTSPPLSIVPVASSVNYSSSALPVGLGTYCVQVSGSAVPTSWYGGATGVLPVRPLVGNCSVLKDATGITITGLYNPSNSKNIALGDYASTAIVYSFYPTGLFDAATVQSAINTFTTKLARLTQFDRSGITSLLGVCQAKISDPRAAQFSSNPSVSTAISGAQASYNLLNSKLLGVAKQSDLDALSMAYSDYLNADTFIVPVINGIIFSQKQCNASLGIVGPQIDGAVAAKINAQDFFKVSVPGATVPLFS